LKTENTTRAIPIPSAGFNAREKRERTPKGIPLSLLSRGFRGQTPFKKIRFPRPKPQLSRPPPEKMVDFDKMFPNHC
jgi:hypothetical protein